MLKRNYVRWSKKMVIIDMLGILTWTSLSTFMLMSKNAIGVSNIPIFEFLIFIVGVLGVSLAHNKFMSVKGSVLARNIQETIFLISLFYILIYTNDLAIAGYAVYAVIISSAIVNKITNETARSYEDINFKTYASTQFLKRLRKRNQFLELIAGAFGTSIAVLFLTIGEVNIITFTLIMLILNVMQNAYEYFIWKKYL